MTRYTLGHVDISALGQGRPYKSDNSRVRARAIQRIRDEHGPRLVEEYRTAFDDAQRDRPKGNKAVPESKAVVLEVELSPQAGVTDLTRKREKTRQGAVRLDQTSGAQKIAFIVPDDKRDVLAALLQEYAYGDMIHKGDKADQAPNEGRVVPIDHIRKGTFETFWQDDPEALPEDPTAEIWWALWCFRDEVDRVIDVARKLGCRVAEPDAYLQFPDTVVIPVYGPKLNIEIILFGTLGVAELRRASDSPTFFLEEARGEAAPWMEDLAERVTWPGIGVPVVCLLGTGVNRGHVLLEPAVSPDVIDAVKKPWGVDDHTGHDTGMAGLALHGDLTAALADQGARTLGHRVESVKILPPPPFNPNEPNAYGPIIQAATAIAEFNDPEAPFRVYCLSVTNGARSGAETTGWSAAIDQAAAGATVGDNESAPLRRLFVVSTGNIQDDAAPMAIKNPDAFPAEDPCQAWNGITVGGYTDKTEISDKGYEQWSAWAKPGELNPYSCSTYLWRQRKSPIKPEVVFEAGNRALSWAGTEAVAGLPSLSLLTTGANSDEAPLEPFWATSAAAALGARMAAQIAAAHPEYWPETLRALMVHSASWTGSMRNQLGNTANATARVDLMRRFGYGVPSLERALASAKNSLAIISQRAIQPYRQVGSDVRFNEAHVYRLPWPTEMLEDLGDTTVRLKVTLSYFIEPNPGFSASIDPLRYQSFGLRFDLKRALESSAMFLKRRNVDERREGEKNLPITPDSGWLLGERKASAGSLHCDVWQGTAAQLAARNMMWVYPVNGWWRERKTLGRTNREGRYALVLTLETDDAEIDLHTPISALVQPLVNVPIDSV